MEATITTRFLIISDTHSLDFQDVEKCGGSFKPPFPKANVLLRCGDMTEVGGIDELEKVVGMLGKIEAELKLVIAGNHDLNLDPDFWKGHIHDFSIEEHKTAVETMTGQQAKDAGITYLEEGLNTFTLKNGAKFTIYTSPYTPEFCDWGFPYERNEDRFNPSGQMASGNKEIGANPIPDHGDIDIVMTHGPPMYILDQCLNGNVGCNSLLRAVSRCRPRLHCFGHIHEDHGASTIKWGEDITALEQTAIACTSTLTNSYPEVDVYPVEFGKETLMVNAAIMNVKYKPKNAPWLLDLELPRA